MCVQLQQVIHQGVLVQAGEALHTHNRVHSLLGLDVRRARNHVHSLLWMQCLKAEHRVPSCRLVKLCTHTPNRVHHLLCEGEMRMSQAQDALVQAGEALHTHTHTTVYIACFVKVRCS